MSRISNEEDLIPTLDLLLHLVEVLLRLREFDGSHQPVVVLDSRSFSDVFQEVSKVIVDGISLLEGFELLVPVRNEGEEKREGRGNQRSIRASSSLSFEHRTRLLSEF